MAVTSIWAVTHRVDNVLKYIENPDKTIERPELSPEAIAARKALGDVVNYVENSDKTEQMMFVSGINCEPKTAADDSIFEDEPEGNFVAFNTEVSSDSLFED